MVFHIQHPIRALRLVKKNNSVNRTDEVSKCWEVGMGWGCEGVSDLIDFTSSISLQNGLDNSLQPFLRERETETETETETERQRVIPSHKNTYF